MKIISLERSVRGKIPLKKLKREAMKRKINPAIEDERIELEVTKTSGSSFELAINYETPVTGLSAYKHASAYTALAKELGEDVSPGIIHVKTDISSSSSFANGWTLERCLEKDLRGKVEEELLDGKAILWAGVYGDSSRIASEEGAKELLSHGFDKIASTVGDIKVRDVMYKGNRVLGPSPFMYLGSVMDSFNERDVIDKIKSAKKWLKPINFVHIFRDDDSEKGIEKVQQLIGKLYICKTIPKGVGRIEIAVPTSSLEDGRVIVARHATQFDDYFPL